MPEISFYILPSDTQQARYFFVCKLVEKIYRSGKIVFIRCDSEPQIRQLDNLLWTFRQGSFIPHQIFTGEVPDINRVILLGTLSPPDAWQTTIVNLSDKNTDYSHQTKRILEILDNSELSKQAGRNRYRQYQQSGCQINTYKM